MQTEIDPRDLIGHKAVDRNGDKIGTIDEVYLDDATGEPEWAAVRTGLFGRDAFVPLTTSEFVSDELRVPYDKSQVKDSPDFGVGQHLSPAQELQLYRYYGLELPAGAGQDGSGSGSASGNGAGTAAGTAGTAAGAGGEAKAAGTAAAAAPAAAAAAVAAHEVSKPAAAPQPAAATPGPESTQSMPTVAAPTEAPSSRTAAFMSTPQSAQTAPQTTPQPAAPQPAAAQPAAAPPQPAPVSVTRPVPDPLTDPLVGQPAGGNAASTSVPEPIEFVCREERLDISTEWSVLGHARLRRYVTSEQVERRVPVVRERIRVERVPVGADERAQLTDQEITESTEEVTLHEERVIVRKAVVPVERIRLVTERFTEEQIVRDELHREHIQVQDSTRASGPTAVPGGGPGAGPAQGSTPGTGGARPEPFPRTGDTGSYPRSSGDTGHAIGA